MSTETTTTSYGSRVGSAFKGLLIGFVLILASIALLFWNEGRAIKRTKALTEAGNNVVEVDSSTLDVANDGKLIHISGDVITDEILSDEAFGVSVNALLLTRKVETYQWQEEAKTQTRRTSGGGEETTTTYSYNKVWSESLIDSSKFHDSGHDNPISVDYMSEQFQSSSASLGAFSLTPEQIKNLGPSVTYDVSNLKPQNDATTSVTPVTTEPSATPSTAEEVPAAYTPSATSESFTQNADIVIPIKTDSSSEPVISIDAPTANVTPIDAKPIDSTITVNPQANTTSTSNLVILGAGYYIGNPKSPRIGDQKVTFTYVQPPCPTSFIGQQSGERLINYQAKTGEVFLQSAGIKSSDEMIASAKQSNQIITWILRIFGFILLFNAFKMLFAPLEVMADIIPFARTIVGFGSSVVALGASFGIGLITIAIGWFYYRPVIGGVLVVIAVAAIVFPFLRGRKKQNQTA